MSDALTHKMKNKCNECKKRIKEHDFYCKECKIEISKRMEINRKATEKRRDRAIMEDYEKWAKSGSRTY